jgi:hypothetical protein
MILTWHEDAEQEYTSAALYDEQQVENLGLRFVAQVEATVTQVLSAPLRPHCFENSFRKLLVRRFPYAVIYRVKGHEVQILALAHAKRLPGYCPACASPRAVASVGASGRAGERSSFRRLPPTPGRARR